VLDEMVGLLKTPEDAALYPRFQDLVSRLVRMAGGIGWGYGDHADEEFAHLCGKLACGKKDVWACARI
jgi:hypothetical protein